MSFILIAQIVNFAFNPSNRVEMANWVWHVQFVLGGVLGAALIVCGLAVPESRVWQELRRKRLQKQQLKKQKQVDAVSKPLHATPVTFEHALPAPSPSLTSAQVRKGWSGLFHPSNCRWVSLALLLAAQNQLTGVNAIMYYAPRIFEDAGFERLALVLTITVVSRQQCT